jgi:DGQHR domain-containing protein
MNPAAAHLERRALAIRQHPNHEMYLFALRADEILKIAAISRIARTSEAELIGYQRQEVRKHVEDILDYLNSGDILFPNALILAFSESVRFRRSRGPSPDDGLAQAGTLEIPLPEEGEAPPAWLVDGQQRALALARSSRPEFAVPVVGFVASQVQVQRDQFIRVNSSRPLPRALLTELLPETDLALPRWIAARKLPSAIVDTLNNSPESPFFRLVKRPSSRAHESASRALEPDSAVVTDTALVEMVRSRLHDSGGCLFPYRNVATGETDGDSVLRLLVAYWSAVRAVFPDAWGIPPTRSRLMHGAGIKAMGSLMDAIISRLRTSSPSFRADLEAEMRRVVEVCAWTSGVWKGMGAVPWNSVEDTPRDVRLLSNHLLREYLARANAP